jgi:chitin disaccharide deacetylase
MMPSYRQSERPAAFALVADDYALTEGVSRSILDLIERGRLTGTGAMTNMPAWTRMAGALRAHDGRVDAGLHLNLTLGTPLGPMPKLCGAGALPPLSALAARAFSGRLDKAEIASEIMRQVDAFVDAFGRLPDYVDGHQHAHVLPGVRSALMQTIAARWPGEPPVVRNPFDTPGAILARGVAIPKAGAIAALSLGFGRRLDRARIPSNRGFSGVSPFDPARSYGAEFSRFLVAPGTAHLVMCHPGYPDAELARLDPVTGSRQNEHDFLGGDDVLRVLGECDLKLERLSVIAR